MSKIVCIDSNIAIWGIKQQGDASLIDKARVFFEQLDENGIQILVPTIVIAEILVKEMPQKHPVFLKIISENFIVGDFNSAVAQVYGDLMGKNLAAARQIRSSENISNDKMKFDFAIISIAKFYGASCIYTYDPDLFKFGNNVIDIRQIPALYTQTTFDYSGS